ncbi:unnamed protein product [Staurois parvus]|uniref:Uncharacterized protein n=1 Tax=Staurois parvus TaxID=386267 RepID=A0ABN9CSR8_9NEOB|nr:unnamed protein product [Staurois parvus]
MQGPGFRNTLSFRWIICFLLHQYKRPVTPCSVGPDPLQGRIFTFPAVGL